MDNTRPLPQDGAHARLRAQRHPRCFVCADHATGGLHIHFAPSDDASIVGTCQFDSQHQGYPGLVHGGVVAAALDGAMTNCLFAQGIAAVTAELVVRYRHPVRLGLPARITAEIAERRGEVIALRSIMTQDGRTVASARAKFVSNAAAAALVGEAHAYL